MSPGKVSSVDFEKFYNIVDGKQRSSDQIHHGINPSTGKELWDVPIASEKDLNDAVAAAKKAFPAWRDLGIEKRKETLGKLMELYNQHSDEFTTLLCAESGKPVRTSQSANPDYANHYAEEICLYGGWRCCWIHGPPPYPRRTQRCPGGRREDCVYRIRTAWCLCRSVSSWSTSD